MLTSLAADMAEVLSVSSQPLEAATELIAQQLDADRVSLVHFEDDGLVFRVLATAGVELCSPGTRLPIASSTHYRHAMEGRPFTTDDLERVKGFDRSSDRLILSRGFRSSCSIPLTRGSTCIGALNAVSFRDGAHFEEAMAELASLSGMLTLALAAEPPQHEQRVLVCHDDLVYGMGLARLCEQSGCKRVVVHESLDEAIQAVEQEPPDMIVCDNYLGGRRVDDVIATLRRAGAAAPIVVVATYDTVENANAAVRAGASAYVRRAEAVEALGLSLGLLRSGRTSLPPETPGVGSESLTLREVEVLRLLDDGLRLKQIALQLGVSESTAKNHVRNIFRKLDATSRTEALNEVRRQGMLC